MLSLILFTTISAYAHPVFETIEDPVDVRAVETIVRNIFFEPEREAERFVWWILNDPALSGDMVNPTRALDVAAYLDAVETARARGLADPAHVHHGRIVELYERRLNRSGGSFEFRSSLDLFTRLLLSKLARSGDPRVRHFLALLMKTGRPYWADALVKYLIAPRPSLRLNANLAQVIGALLPVTPDFAAPWVDRALAEHALDEGVRSRELRDAFAKLGFKPTCEDLLFDPRPGRRVNAN